MVGIIKELVVITGLKAQFPSKLPGELDRAVIANIVAGNALEGGKGVARAQLVGFLADDKGILQAELVALTEGVVQAKVEGVGLVVILGAVEGLLVVILQRVFVTHVEGGPLEDQRLADLGVDFKAEGVNVR